MDSIRELVDRVMAEQCWETFCLLWGKYSCEADGCSNHACVLHQEKCLDCGSRFCLACYPEHKHCTACGAVGKIFSSRLCGICDSVRIHEAQVINRLTTDWEDSE